MRRQPERGEYRALPCGCACGGGGRASAALPAADAQPGDPAHAIYISPDSGATCTYLANGNISDAYAVFNVIFPSSDLEYHLAFDYKVEGEASAYMEFDYMKVYMLDASATIPATGAPSGVALLHNLDEVANVTDWTHFDMILDNVAGTAKQIVFYWYNNGWTTTCLPPWTTFP